MILPLVLDKLLSTVPALSNRVALSANVDAALAELKTSPQAWVINAAEAASANQTMNAVTQLVTEQFSILLAVRNVSDVTGGAALVELDVIREAIKAAVIGWEIQPEDSPIHWRGGRVVTVGDGWVVYLDAFESTRIFSQSFS